MMKVGDSRVQRLKQGWKKAVHYVAFWLAINCNVLFKEQIIQCMWDNRETHTDATACEMTTAMKAIKPQENGKGPNRKYFILLNSETAGKSGQMP
jgi:hypothetical protein